MNAKQLSYKEKLKVLEANGVDTSKLVSIADDGYFKTTENEEQRKILATGAIEDPRLFRRWITAKNLRLYHDAYDYKILRKRVIAEARKDYKMQKYVAISKHGFAFGNLGHVPRTKKVPKMWKVIIDEMVCQCKMKKHGDDEYELRRKFFNEKVLLAMLRATKMNARAKTLEFALTYRKDSFCNPEIIRALKGYVRGLKYNDRTRRGIVIPEEYIEAYIRAGAYYSAQNLITFGSLKYKGENGPRGFENFSKDFAATTTASEAYKSFRNLLTCNKVNKFSIFLGWNADYAQLRKILDR